MKFFFIFTVLCCLINIYLWCCYKRLWMCSSMYWSNIIFYTLNEKIWTIVCHFRIFNLTVRQIVHKLRVGCWFSVYCWRLTMTCTINKPTEVSMITYKLCGFCVCDCPCSVSKLISMTEFHTFLKPMSYFVCLNLSFKLKWDWFDSDILIYKNIVWFCGPKLVSKLRWDWMSSL